jgi:hypothetical protein
VAWTLPGWGVGLRSPDETVEEGACRWVRSGAVLWRRVMDDVVLLPPAQQDPIALARGARLWDLLNHPSSTAELASALGGATTTEPLVVRSDLEHLLADLARRGAVRCLA